MCGVCGGLLERIGLRDQAAGSMRGYPATGGRGYEDARRKVLCQEPGCNVDLDTEITQKLNEHR